MASLPNDIIHYILSQSEISVDTFLAFKSYGLVPKNVVIPDGLQESLDKMLKRRKREYDEHLRVYKEHAGFVDIVRLDKMFSHIDDDTTMEMGVYLCGGVVQYSFMVVRMPADLFGYDVRRSPNFDMHTGAEILPDFD